MATKYSNGLFVLLFLFVYAVGIRGNLASVYVSVCVDAIVHIHASGDVAVALSTAVALPAPIAVALPAAEAIAPPLDLFLWDFECYTISIGICLCLCVGKIFW